MLLQPSAALAAVLRDLLSTVQKMEERLKTLESRVMEALEDLQDRQGEISMALHE